MQTPDREELIAKVPMLTREQFELRLINIETNYQLAFESAKAMDYLTKSARDLARQRRMNMMVELQIAALEDETNITVNVDREEHNCQVPFPPRINHNQTMLNFDNKR